MSSIYDAVVGKYAELKLEPNTCVINVKIYQNSLCGVVMALFNKAVKMEGMTEGSTYVNIKSLKNGVIHYGLNRGLPIEGINEKTLTMILSTCKKKSNTYLKRFASINFHDFNADILKIVHLESMQVAKILDVNENDLKAIFYRLKKSGQQMRTANAASFINCPLIQKKASTAQEQFNLGVFYVDHSNRYRDKGIMQYVLSASQQHPIAQNNLGVCYESGKGVIQNDKEAIWWYQLAASQGVAEAFTNLGVMSLRGRGTVQDFSLSFQLFQKAVILGDLAALNNIGCMYKNGSGRPIDLPLANKIFYIGALLGDPVALDNYTVTSPHIDE